MIIIWVYKVIGITCLAGLGFMTIIYNIGKEAREFNKMWYGKTHKNKKTL